MKWLPIWSNLPDHYKTQRAAAALEVGVAAMVGYLVNLWIWAVEYAADGSLKGFSYEDIARAARVEPDAPFTPDRFVEALVGCGRDKGAGFLEFDPQGVLVLHEWMERDHAGGHAQKLKRESKRVMESRAKNQNDGQITRKLRVTYEGDSSSLLSTPTKEERGGVRGRDVDGYAEVTRNSEDAPLPAADVAALWDAALSKLRGEMTSTNYDILFAGTSLLSIDADSGEAVIATTSALALDSLRSRCGPMTSAALSQVAGRPLTCRFVAQQR